MPTLVAPGVCRFSINGAIGDQQVVNIFDLNLSDLTLADRQEAAEHAAGDVLNQWADHILPLVASAYVFNSVSWVDLDNLDGSTGEVTSTDGFTLPLTGGISGGCMPAGVAILVRKVTSGGRRDRNGRMYITGVPESYTSFPSVNNLDAGVVTSFNTAVEAMRSGLEGNEVTDFGNYTSSPQVVHTVNGVYTSKSRITLMTTDDRLATQRRRQR